MDAPYIPQLHIKITAKSQSDGNKKAEQKTNEEMGAMLVTIHERDGKYGQAAKERCRICHDRVDRDQHKILHVSPLRC
jgi:hypothetical protein